MKNKLNKISFLLLTSTLVVFGSILSERTVHAQSFANGADVGFLSQMESQGYVFVNDSGVQEDCLKILQEHGINALRFRVWVNPDNGWCGKKDVTYMAPDKNLIQLVESV